MPKITFTPFEKTVDTDGSKTLLQLAQEAHIPLLSTCGGKKKCGKCAVMVGSNRNPLPPASKSERAVLGERVEKGVPARLRDPAGGRRCGGGSGRKPHHGYRYPDGCRRPLGSLPGLPRRYPMPRGGSPSRTGLRHRRPGKTPLGPGEKQRLSPSVNGSFCIAKTPAITAFKPGGAHGNLKRWK